MKNEQVMGRLVLYEGLDNRNNLHYLINKEEEEESLKQGHGRF